MSLATADVMVDLEITTQFFADGKTEIALTRTKNYGGLILIAKAGLTQGWLVMGVVMEVHTIPLNVAGMEMIVQVKMKSILAATLSTSSTLLMGSVMEERTIQSSVTGTEGTALNSTNASQIVLLTLRMILAMANVTEVNSIHWRVDGTGETVLNFRQNSQTVRLMILHILGTENVIVGLIQYTILLSVDGMAETAWGLNLTAGGVEIACQSTLIVVSSIQNILGMTTAMEGLTIPKNVDGTGAIVLRTGMSLNMFQQNVVIGPALTAYLIATLSIQNILGMASAMVGHTTPKNVSGMVATV